MVHLLVQIFVFTAEEEDVFQCGKCKRKFTNLSQFFAHKQNQCIVAEPTSDTTSNSSTIASVHSAGMTNTNVIYTTQLAHAQSNKQITVIICLSCQGSYARVDTQKTQQKNPPQAESNFSFLCH